jgi:LCCL domain
MRLLAVIAMAGALAGACNKERAAPASSQAAPGREATTSSVPVQRPDAGGPSSPASPGGTVSNSAADPMALLCNRSARDLEGNDGTSWFMRCPACGEEPHAVWGTDFYTDDSVACAAAIHAGAITRAGGVVLLTWTKGQPTYAGSPRNGIATSDYGAWGRSFFVQAVGADGRPTSAPPTAPPDGTVRASCTTRGDMIPDATRVICPPGCATGQLWGTDVYTGDSAVCLAAVHGGQIALEQGGEARLSRAGKQESFHGSTRNGLTSSDYGAWDASFRLSR